MTETTQVFFYKNISLSLHFLMAICQSNHQKIEMPLLDKYNDINMKTLTANWE